MAIDRFPVHAPAHRLMPRVVYFAAPGWAGIKHRFVTLNHIQTFASHFGYRAHFLWGISGGVGYCRFEELLTTVPGVQVINVPEQELADLEQAYRRSKSVRFRNQSFSVYRKGTALSDRMLAYDLSWDLGASTALQKLVPSRFHPALPVYANPSAEIRRKASAYIRQHALMRRVGIRVRVTESPDDGRTLHRIQKELDDTVKSIIRMPWFVGVFVVTDSEYIQQMLASHFHDTRFLPKRFPSREVGGGYIDRNDPDAMRKFLTEVACLAACWKIVNIGGFVNEQLLGAKIIQPPYERSLFCSGPALSAHRAFG